MLFKDVMLAIAGVNERDMYHQHLLRRVTFIIASAGFNGKHTIANMNKTWPVDSGEVNISERNKRILARFKEIDVKQKAKQLNDARGSKDSSRCRYQAGRAGA